MYVRAAEKAGSWYEQEQRKLQRQMEGWISEVPEKKVPAPRAIIGPHAGYSYSAPTAAHAYNHIDPSQVKTVILLGPMHRKYLKDRCMVTHASRCETPLGPIEIDTQLAQELHDTEEFTWMTKRDDEEEHSTELHMPYICHVMKGHPFKMVHIMVGSLSRTREVFYGKFFSRYLDDPSFLFVISSDFCHWGSRFDYVHYDDSHGEIHQHISHLDHQAMDIISSLDGDAFERYMKETKNTICGRKPIAVLLEAVRHASTSFSLTFTHYAQSSACRSFKDSSVSYASAILQPTISSSSSLSTN
eukprot:TRINITY_DN742_c0_g2_i1.p1 TRINITY_DN742_c0_g2~~TRINITY_DN742_c0_g2_i1.p1  ORF type:complete len:346 (+),score=95.63 TRINITY_DN742_c0_g2_i1:137-1039(+)